LGGGRQSRQKKRTAAVGGNKRGGKIAALPRKNAFFSLFFAVSTLFFAVFSPIFT
jgi:hypothetical protein